MSKNLTKTKGSKWEIIFDRLDMLSQEVELIEEELAGFPCQLTIQIQEHTLLWQPAPNGQKWRIYYNSNQTPFLDTPIHIRLQLASHVGKVLQEANKIYEECKPK